MEAQRVRARTLPAAVGRPRPLWSASKPASVSSIFIPNLEVTWKSLLAHMCALDTVLQALANERRRLSLLCILEHRSVTLPDLAEFVAEHEREETLADISSEYVRDVYFSLYHNHIPKLDEADLVRYDQGNDLVLRTEETLSALSTARERLSTLQQKAK